MSLSIYYFAYGSNLHFERLKRRTPTAVFMEVATLSSYKVCFHKLSRDGSAKCNVVPRHGCNVVGVVYRLSFCDQVALDLAEGRGYRRAWVDVHGMHTGTRCHALTYIAKDIVSDKHLLPYDWYKAFVIEGAKSHGIQDSYIDQSRAIPSQPDFHHLRNRKSRLTVSGNYRGRRRAAVSTFSSARQKALSSIRIVTRITTRHLRKGYK